MRGMRLRNVFLFGVVMLTLVFGTIYTVGQHILRQGANDPQIQFAEDIATVLSESTKPADLASNTKVDVAKSLAPFLVVTDEKGTVLTTTGELDSQVPAIPQGVLEAAKKKGENRITWQPRNGVRIALVITSYPDGFVAVGRSLREVEARTQGLLYIVGVAWGLCVCLLAFGGWRANQHMQHSK